MDREQVQVIMPIAHYEGLLADRELLQRMLWQFNRCDKPRDQLLETVSYVYRLIDGCNHGRDVKLDPDARSGREICAWLCKLHGIEVGEL
jgi:hypothetical protein